MTHPRGRRSTTPVPTSAPNPEDSLTNHMEHPIVLPRRLDIAGERSTSGISITWAPTAQRLDISGWHSSFVGIEGDSFTLREFLDRLGITEKDCAKAFR